MSEQKQIEEMAKVIEKTEQIARDAYCGYPSPTMYAKDLYWHGCRRQIEGEWKPIMQELNYCDTLECSLCGAVIDISETHYKYCPICGAKMKGVAE